MSSERAGHDANRTFGFDGPGLPTGDDPAVAAPGGTTTLGKYRIVRTLGTGGMANVHEAVHRNGNRVALKVLHAALSRDAGVRARFLQEGYAANTVGHPGAVRVLDDDVADDGSVFLVMELLEGETLATRAARGGHMLPETEVATVGIALLDVLAAAHARGVVHRDVKPDNLFLTHDGVVKVLDFGIAQVRASPTAGMTLAGQQIGTPAFMAPEQAQGRTASVDARTDLWAVGATLYALLCGHPVHGDGSAAEIVIRAATLPAPPLGHVRPTTAPDLAAVIDRALQTDPTARWQDAAEMRDALLRCDAAAGGTLTMMRPTRSASDTMLLRETTDGASRLETFPPPTTTASSPTGPAPANGGFGRRARVAGALLAGVVGVGTVVALLARTPSPPQGRLSCDSAAACAAAGTPARCSDGTCRPLLVEGCRLLAEPGDVESDDTIWLGAMFPLSGPEAVPFGEPCLRAVDLARTDFAESVGGLPPTDSGAGGVRRIAVVACDDRENPAAMASHLLDDVRVPAVIGFARSREVTELALSHFHPRGAVALAANLAPSISEIPVPADGTRLVYRVTSSTTGLTSSMAAFVSENLAPTLEQRLGSTTRSPLRVAVVRVENASGVGTAGVLTEHLRFNGRPALDNGDAYRQVRVPDSLTAPLSDTEIQRVADELVAFAPHVIVGAGGLEPPILAAVEGRWTASNQRPTYVTDWLEPGDVEPSLARHPDLQGRLYRVDAARSSRTTQRFVLRYNERYTPDVTPTTALPEPYDAFYLAAFALAAGGPEAAHDGRTLARAFPRLQGPGRPVEAAADDIAGALATLTSGGSIDLEGAATNLDFEPLTGEPSATAAVYCLTRRPTGYAFVDAGVTFDAHGSVVGSPRCE